MSIKLDASCYYFIVNQIDYDLLFIDSMKELKVKKGPPPQRASDVVDQATLHVVGLFETAQIKHAKWNSKND